VKQSRRQGWSKQPVEYWRHPKVGCSLARLAVFPIVLGLRHCLGRLPTHGEVSEIAGVDRGSVGRMMREWSAAGLLEIPNEISRHENAAPNAAPAAAPSAAPAAAPSAAPASAPSAAPAAAPADRGNSHSRPTIGASTETAAAPTAAPSAAPTAAPSAAPTAAPSAAPIAAPNAAKAPHPRAGAIPREGDRARSSLETERWENTTSKHNDVEQRASDQRGGGGGGVSDLDSQTARSRVEAWSIDPPFVRFRIPPPQSVLDGLRFVGMVYVPDSSSWSPKSATDASRAARAIEKLCAPPPKPQASTSTPPPAAAPVRGTGGEFMPHWLVTLSRHPFGGELADAVAEVAAETMPDDVGLAEAVTVVAGAVLDSLFDRLPIGERQAVCDTAGPLRSDDVDACRRWAQVWLDARIQADAAAQALAAEAS
jgi:hypothetical protein